MKRAALLSAAAGLLLTLLIFAAGNLRKSPPLPESWDLAGAGLSDLAGGFEADNSGQNLLRILKALCYRAEEENDAEARRLIVPYGTELYRRAREEGLDLQRLDDEETMLRLLGILGKYGARDLMPRLKM
ncbi:MAG: hypothetical protein LBS57_02300 [Treponema sp.]|nr:hypothetical protein [Treponema sp.]